MLLAAAVVWVTVAELTWVDHRPVCSGLAMHLRPELAGDCFTGPRPLFVDAAVTPAMIGALALVSLVGLAVIGGRISGGRRPPG
ncbi:MAG TPA: hypothetical protein VKC59_06175 [Candidatus Limnocylindrales bacterium]|nr:hypothetical protein [Candidatus Limnocylindrales bacterium]